jgi:hypothetical protein
MKKDFVLALKSSATNLTYASTFGKSKIFGVFGLQIMAHYLQCLTPSQWMIFDKMVELPYMIMIISVLRNI